MGVFKGGFLRLTQTALYFLCFCCAGIILGIYSYYLAVLADRDLPIAKWKQAVEGLSGAAVVYTILTTLLTCCLAGITFLSMLGLVFDILFVGAMIAIAIMTRHGASSCKGNVRTPLGNGPANSNAAGYGANGFGFGSGQNATYSPNLGLACRLNTAAFAVSIIAAVLFLITALMQLALIKHHKKEKAYGPSPTNNYTSGSGRRRGMFGRKNKNADVDAEKGPIGTHGHPANGIRPSHDTAYTGSTVAAPGAATLQKDTPAHDHHAPHVGYESHTNNATHSGYYTAPQGVGNPFILEDGTVETGAPRRNF